MFIHDIVCRVRARDQWLTLLDEKWPHQLPAWDTLKECRVLVDCYETYIQVDG